MSEMCVLELPLHCEEYQTVILNKKMECARKIYNNMLNGMLKNYNRMTKTKKWSQLQADIKAELKKNTGKKKNDTLKALYDERNSLIRENGFTEFDFYSIIAEYNCYKENISSRMAELSIAKPMWVSFEQLLYGKGKAVHFKKYTDVISLASNGKSGIRLVEEDGHLFIIVSNRTYSKKKMLLPIKDKNLTDYEKELLKSGQPKIVRIVKKDINGKDNFYVQLTFASAPPIKYDKEGNIRNPLGKGKVGISIWRGTLYAVSDAEVYSVCLLPEHISSLDEKIKKLSTEMEKLRRLNNEENYNEDGTIKKGIMVDGKKQKLEWHNSRRYLEKKRQLKELHRYCSECKKLHHNDIINHLLSMGDTFVMQELSFITKKEAFSDEENRKTNTEYRKKKDRRRSIQNNAPASLITKLNQKVKTATGNKIERIDIPEDMYWYNHVIGAGTEPFEEIFSPDETEFVSQTAYRAFLISKYDKKKKSYNQSECLEKYDNFKKLYLEM